MPARQNEVRADQQPQKPQPQKPQAESAGLAEVTRRGFLGMVAGLLPAAWAAAPAPAAPVFDFRLAAATLKDSRTFEQLLGDAVANRMIQEYRVMPFPFRREAQIPAFTEAARERWERQQRQVATVDPNVCRVTLKTEYNVVPADPENPEVAWRRAAVLKDVAAELDRRILLGGE